MTRQELKEKLIVSLKSFGAIPSKFCHHDIERASAAGFLLMKDLNHGTYYFGECRNAEVARWNDHEKRFYYIRTKFGSSFVESIEPFELDEGFDVFMPIGEAEPLEDEKVPLTKEF